ncbi:hypothetical protein PQX77_014090 [Marasmius sp. AFHP31]|nr:hypothetical protein PQX77_014090 [Marasmius sp. AFHP31]
MSNQRTGKQVVSRNTTQTAEGSSRTNARYQVQMKEHIMVGVGGELQIKTYSTKGRYKRDKTDEEGEDDDQQKNLKKRRTPTSESALHRNLSHPRGPEQTSRGSQSERRNIAPVGADPSTANSSSSTIGKTRKSSPPPPHSLDVQAKSHDGLSCLPLDAPPAVATWRPTSGSSSAFPWVLAPPVPTVEVAPLVAQSCATNELFPTHPTAPPPPANQTVPQTPFQIPPFDVGSAYAFGPMTIGSWNPLTQPGSSYATAPRPPFPSLPGSSQGFEMPHGLSEMQIANPDRLGAEVVQGGRFQTFEPFGQHPQTQFHFPSGPVTFAPGASLQNSESGDLDAEVRLLKLKQEYAQAQRRQEVRLRRMIAHLEAQQNSRGAHNIQEPTQLPPHPHITSGSLPAQWTTIPIEQLQPLQPQPRHFSTSPNRPLHIQQARQPYPPVSHPSPSSLGPSSPYSSSYPSSPASHVPFPSFSSPASSSSPHSFSPVPVSPSASSPSASLSDRSSPYNDPIYRDLFHGGSPGSSYISASFDRSRPPTQSPSATVPEFELPD